MNYDSKAYLYSVYMNTFKNFVKSEDCFEYVTRLLGDFKISPGSIKQTQDPESYVKRIHFTPEISSRTKIENFTIDALGNIEVVGKTPFSIIRIDENKSDKTTPTQKRIGFITNYEDNTAGYYCIEDKLDKINILFYDLETIRTLRDSYNMNFSQIVRMDRDEMYNFGFSPDKVYKYEFVKSHDTMENYLLHSYNDLPEEFLNEFCDMEEEKRQGM